MKYKLAIFDMDGTILDTLEDLKDSLNFALDSFNYPLRTLSEVQSFVGNGIKKLIERAAPKSADDNALTNLYEIFTERYKVHCKDKTKPYNGIIEAVDYVKSLGIQTAVVSNKDDYAVKELSALYFGDRFPLSLGVTKTVEKKPAPDMVQIVLNHYNMDKQSTVYIGDSEVDFLTAKNSELDFIGAAWGFKGYDFLQNLGAKVIANNPLELKKLITTD